MAVNLTFSVKSFAFGSTVTYNNTNGGPMTMRLTDDSQELETRTANDFYPANVKMVNGSCQIVLTVAEFAPQDITVGDQQTCTILLEDASSDQTMVIYRMVFRGATASQDRASEGTTDLTFVYESSDGQKGPFTT